MFKADKQVLETSHELHLLKYSLPASYTHVGTMNHSRNTKMQSHLSVVDFRTVFQALKIHFSETVVSKPEIKIRFGLVRSFLNII